MDDLKIQPVILIVDDNQQNIHVLGSMLEEHDYEIAVAMAGRDALDYMKQQKVDLILLDIMMPEMDGYEVCKNLKSDKRTKEIPVIFLTALGEVENIVKGFEVGGVDYVTKPFESAELLARIKTHLELRRAHEEIKTLQGILPICSICKNVRNDSGYWEQVEQYITNRTGTEFTHSYCPECAKKYFGVEKKVKEE